MASSLVFSSNVFEFPSTGHIGVQRPPAGSSTRSTHVRFRRCFKARAVQASVGAESAISNHGHMESRNLYEVLAVCPSATAKDIKRAYRKLAREFHPDQAASPEDKNESTQMFLRIHNAYVTLSDPHERAQYDRQLWAPLRGFAGQTWNKAANGRTPAYTNYGHMGRSWESDQCWWSSSVMWIFCGYYVHT